MNGQPLTRSGAFVACLLMALVVGALTVVACGGSSNTTSSSPSATPSGGASSGASQQHGLVWKFKTGAAVQVVPGRLQRSGLRRQ